MIDQNIKDSIRECILKNGLKYTLQMYSCICSASTIRGISKQLMVSSHVVKYPHIYSNEELNAEYSAIQTLKGSYSMVWSKNKNIHHFQPHYFREEMKFLSNKLNYDLLLENRKKYLFKDDINMKEMLRGCKIAGCIRGYSHFSPLIIKKFIEDNNIVSVYDPCGGWGHRLLGSGKTPYIYNDIWKDSVSGVNSMVKHHGLIDKVMYQNDCTSFTPTQTYQSVFTCPPYFNKEIYSSGFSNMDDYKNFLEKMILKSFIEKHSATIMGTVICHDYVDLLQYTINKYAKVVDIIDIVKNRNHFEKNSLSTKSNEFLVISCRH